MKALKRFGAEIVRLAIFAVIVGAIPASSQVWKWSQTPGTNATADPHINWAEGMAPSAVNDSARAMMAEFAKYRDDISGAISTGGTSTAYTISTNQGLCGSPCAAPVNGQMIAFKAHATNGNSPTLAVDGGTAYPIQSPAGTAIGGGTLIGGSSYRVSFNSSESSWILESLYGNPYAIPLGGYLYSSIGSAPNSSFVLANGQCISRTTYSAYFAAVGTTYGACDGSTTFAVPNATGRVLAMSNSGGSVLNVDGCGGGLGTVCGSSTRTLDISQMPSHNHGGFTGFMDRNNPHTHATSGQGIGATGGFDIGVYSPNGPITYSPPGLGSADINHLHSIASQGGGQPFVTVQPTIITMIYVRVI